MTFAAYTESHAADVRAFECRPFSSDIPAPPQAVRGRVPARLRLRHGGEHDLQIAYELVGPADAPVVLAAGGISAHRHVIASDAFPEAGWWQSQSGVGLDTARLRVLAIDWLGADGRLDAVIDSADQADAIAAVLDALGIAAVAAFVGSSYGAMVGLQFAARHPRRVGRLVAISGAHRSHPYASAWRALQRQAVALGQLQCDESQGLALARQLAMLSYRTPAEFAERFDAAPTVAHDRVRVAAEDYLEHCAATWVARTSPTAFLRLSESIDLHRVEPREVGVPTTVVAIAEDRLVPLEDLFALSEALPRGEIHVLRSKFGHDAFLIETRAIGDVIVGALDAALQGACGGAA
ncbi:homoserine O-succinyltransferase MetX [Lysobacter hankyongensis]